MKLLLADDHGLFRDSLSIWLEKLPFELTVIFSFDLESTNSSLKSNHFDLLILDLFMPGMEGVISVKSICQQYPDCAVIVVSAEENPSVIQGCLDSGAKGYVPKSASGSTILTAIEQIISGKAFIPNILDQNANSLNETLSELNEKQLKILALIAQGKSNKDIAKTLFLSEGTIKQYVTKLFRILQVDNRVQASIKASKILGFNHL